MSTNKTFEFKNELFIFMIRTATRYHMNHIVTPSLHETLCIFVSMWIFENHQNNNETIETATCFLHLFRFFAPHERRWRQYLPDVAMKGKRKSLYLICGWKSTWIWFRLRHKHGWMNSNNGTMYTSYTMFTFLFNAPERSRGMWGEKNEYKILREAIIA